MTSHTKGGGALGIAAALLWAGSSLAYAAPDGQHIEDGAPASMGDVHALTLTQTSTIAGLAPGSGSQALAGTFDNANDAPVYVKNVSAVVSGTDKTGCTAADYTIAGTGRVDADVDDNDTWGHLTIAFNNTTANQDACKAATVTIGYTATGAAS